MLMADNAQQRFFIQEDVLFVTHWNKQESNMTMKLNDSLSLHGQ